MSTDIYQTLEDRQNYEYVENHGPFFCAKKLVDGKLKTGIKEPWLGEGYYFWDTRINDAHWWGQTIYKKSGYIICHTSYNQHSPLLYDLLGDLRMREEFIKCAELIKHERGVEKVTFAVVLSYLKKFETFNFRAVRVWPSPKYVVQTGIVFPGGEMIFGQAEKTQICFFDKTLLVNPYKITYRPKPITVQTI